MNKIFLITLVLIALLLELVLKLVPFGRIIYSLILIGVLIAIYKSTQEKSAVMAFFIVIPILRILSWFFDFSFFWETLFFYCLLVFVVLSYASQVKIRWIKSRAGFKIGFLTIIIAIILGYCGSILLDFEANNLFILLVPLIAYSEEFLFRGLIQNSAEKQSEEWAVYFSAILYGIFSLNYGILAVGFFFVVSLFSGVIYMKTKNIFLPIIVNMIIHFFLFFVLTW